MIEITEQGNGEDQLGNPNSFILWMTKPWPIKERSFQDHSLVTQSTRHQSMCHGWEPGRGLILPNMQRQTLSSTVTMQHSEGGVRSWESAAFKQKGDAFPHCRFPKVILAEADGLPSPSLPPGFFTDTQKKCESSHDTRLWTHFSEHLTRLGHKEKWPRTHSLWRRKGRETDARHPTHTLASRLCHEQCFPWEQHSYLYS